MHHTRKTHNAHNETQRRLKKILDKNYVVTYRATPHYTLVIYRDGKIDDILPYWVNPHFSKVVSQKVHGRKWMTFESLEDVERLRKRAFYKKRSKSNHFKSTYKFWKRQLHKWWRRQKHEEALYKTKGSYMSNWDI